MRTAYNKTPKTVEESIIKEYGKGFHDLFALGKKYGVSDVTARKIVRQHGFPPLPNKVPRATSKSEIKAICKSYLEGESLKSLVKKHHIPIERVKKILAESEVNLRSAFESRAKYQFDCQKFRCIDSPSAAYWLGFLMADGYVFVNEDKPEYRLCLDLQYLDVSHVELFRSFMRSEHPIKKVVYDDGRESARITFHSKDLLIDLSRYGIVPRKTFDMTFPEMDAVLISHFIRGYFDGDGHWHFPIGRDGVLRHNFGFTCADRSFLEELKLNLMNSCELSDVKIGENKSSKALCLQWGGRNQSKRFFEYVYQSSENLRLERKFDKSFGKIFNDKANTLTRQQPTIAPT